MATGTAKKTTPTPGPVVTGASRYQSATERLTETREEMARLSQATVDAQRELDTIGKMVATAQTVVDAAEKAADAAAAEVVDRQAELMVAAGSADESSAQAARDAAAAANGTARSQLDKAHQDLREVRARFAEESAPIRQKIAEAQSKQRDLGRLVSSLERTSRQAHHAMGLEQLAMSQERDVALKARLQEDQATLASTQAAIDAHHATLDALGKEHPEIAKSREFGELVDTPRAVREIGAAYTGYLEALERWRAHPEAVGVWHEGVYLPTLLTNEQLTAPVIHSILMVSSREATQRGKAMLRQMRENLAEHSAKTTEHRVRVLKSMPSLEEV